MKHRTIYQIASLVMALAMILGSTINTQAAAQAAQTAGTSIYWGALLNAAPTSSNLQGVYNTFETRTGKKMSIIHWGQSWVMGDGSWGEFQTSYFENVRNHGSIPMLNWASQRLGAGTNQANFQLRDIYGGSYDTYILRWAAAAKNWGHPFFLRFNHEMNGWWYPWGEGRTSTGSIVNGNSAGDFVKAWRHVHDIFVSVGATNVTWVWAPNHMSTSDQYPPLSSLYPGDAYVDWTGFSAYNRYSTWLGLNPLLTGKGITWLRNSYNDMLAVAPGKPMMLAEWGSVEAGDGGAKKAAWLTDALTVQIPTNFPKIKAVVYFNWNMEDCSTCAIESSTAATNAWATGIGSAIYASNQYANLNTSPIPAPTGSTIVATATPTKAPATAAPTTAPATATPSTSSGGSANLIAIADTYIDSANPASTAGGASKALYVNASPVQKAFLKFDLTPLAGKTISTVKLKIKTTSHTFAGSLSSVDVKLVDAVLWKEQYMSYNNTVAISATVLGTVPANSAPDTWYEIPLALSPVQERVGGLLSVAIESTGSDDLLFKSREATNKPQLIVTYE